MSSTAVDITDRTQPHPAVLGGVVAYLQVEGATAAAEFYARAFGAQEVARHPVDEKGRTMHIHLYLNGSSVMLSDSYPENGHPALPAQGFTLMMPVKDIDAAFKRAVDAGATVVTPPQVMFWGDKYGELRDPFGIVWSMNQEMPAG